MADAEGYGIYLEQSQHFTNNFGDIGRFVKKVVLQLFIYNGEE